MPIDGALDGGLPQAGAAPVESPVVAPAAVPSTPQTPPSAPQTAPSAPQAPQVAGVAGVGTPAAAFDLRAFANQHIPGVQQRYQSDQALAQELIQAAIQAQQMTPYSQIGQRFAPHIAEFEKWQAQQEQARAAEAAKQQASWWNPPEYDPAWEKGVIRDPATGRLVTLPGHPLDLPAKIEKYQEFQRQKFNEFTQNPIGMLKDGLLPMIREEAQRIAMEQAQTTQQHQFASSYVERSIGWLAQKDAQGRPMYTAAGLPVLSPAGERFNHHVKSLQSAGIRDPRMQADIAEKIVMGELAAMQVQQPGQQQQPGTPAALPAFGTPNHQPNYGNTDVAKPGQSLRDMMWDAMSAAGLATRPTNVI